MAGTGHGVVTGLGSVLLLLTMASVMAKDYNKVRIVEYQIYGGIDEAHGLATVAIGTGNGEVSWGTVCNQSWTARESRVFCRMMGFRTGVVDRNPPVKHAPSSYNIYIAYCACTGMEESLDDCNCSPYGCDNGCTHDMDVAVSCSMNDDGSSRLSTSDDDGGLDDTSIALIVVLSLVGVGLIALIAYVIHKRHVGSKTSQHNNTQRPWRPPSANNSLGYPRGPYNGPFLH